MDDILKTRTEKEADKAFTRFVEAVTGDGLSFEEVELLEEAIHYIIEAAAEKGRGQIQS